GFTVLISVASAYMIVAAAVATIVAIILWLAIIAILYTMWFAAVAACVVERRGPFSAMERSNQLTNGHRWENFGFLLLRSLVMLLASVLIGLILTPLGSTIISFIVSLAWTAIWGAYYAVSVAVSYHDLRVAKEGIDIEQIASVFD